MKFKALLVWFLLSASLVTSQTSNTTIDILSSLDEFIEQVSNENKSMIDKYVFTMVITGKAQDSIECGISYVYQDFWYDFVNAEYYFVRNNKYVVLRFYKCTNYLEFVNSFKLNEIDAKSDSIIRATLFPKDFLLSGDNSSLFLSSVNGKTDTVWYMSSKDIPSSKVYLVNIDEEYISFLNNEMIKTCTEITRSTEFKTRGKAFSYYTDSLYNSIYCFETTSGINYRFPKKYSNNEAFEGVEFNFLENDSIIKLPDSDTLIIIRDDQIFHFPIPY